MKVIIFCEKQNSIYLYKEVLNKVKDCNFHYELLEDYEIKNFSEYNLIIIDLISKKYSKTLKSILSKRQTKTILITSYPIKYLNLQERDLNYLGQILNKPINPQTFLNLIKNQVHILEKRAYLKQREQTLMEVIDKIPLKLGIYNDKGKLIYLNNNYTNNQNIFEDFDKLDFDQMGFSKNSFSSIKNTLLKNKVYFEKEKINPLWYKNYFFNIENTNYIGHIHEDITREILEIDELKRAAMFFEKSNEGMLITDENGNIINTNKAFSKITGYLKDEILGKKPNILNSGIHDKNFYENLWDNLTYNDKWQGEIWNKRKNGEIYPEWLSITKIKDETLKEVNFIAIFNDISSMKEADKKLHFYANYDPLTGLLNRVQFDNMMSHVIQSSHRNNKIFALLFVDLDNFKEVNDTYGHLTGDILLKIVASRIRKTLRKEDVIARIGGDEFNIILENVKNEENAINTANKLNEKIKEEIIIEGKSFFVSFSIGIALYPKHGLDVNSLTKHADAAMYEVKKNGRNAVKVYESKYTLDLIRKVNIQTELKNAILNDNLQMYYQGIYDLKTKSLTGAEALVRWIHKDIGFVSPSEFILIAEDSDLIITLGKYIFQKVLQDIIQINSKFKNNNLKFSINISSKEFFKESFVDNILEKLDGFAISPKQIELEITETHIIKNHNLAIEKFKNLKHSNINLAIDDFGTGYSSLSYLKSFPLNKLKIDQSFIFDILKNKDDLAIVKTIISMAKIFNLKVQAEGVESLEHLKMLEKLGCDFIQGFYYAKPMPLVDFLKFIEENYDK